MNVSHALPTELHLLRERLKRLRGEHGWTLETLAARTALSTPYLSRLESGERQPSIAALLSLAQVYGLSISDLFASPQRHTSVVVRARDASLKLGNGLLHTNLSGRSGEFNLRPIRIVVPHDREGHERYQHDGEEWLYVLAGQLKLSLGTEEHLLSLGDAAHFDARTPHRLVALGGQDAELLLVATTAPRPLLGSYL